MFALPYNEYPLRETTRKAKAWTRHPSPLSWPKVATPGQLVTTGGTRPEDGGKMGDEMDVHSDTDGEAIDTANTPDSWRNTTTQERDTIVGDKLQEVKK